MGERERERREGVSRQFGRGWRHHRWIHVDMEEGEVTDTSDEDFVLDEEEEEEEEVEESVDGDEEEDEEEEDYVGT